MKTPHSHTEIAVVNSLTNTFTQWIFQLGAITVLGCVLSVDCMITMDNYDFFFQGVAANEFPFKSHENLIMIYPPVSIKVKSTNQRTHLKVIMAA